MPSFISDEEMEKLSPSSGGFISDDDMADLESKSDVSPLESGTRGLAQGASLGFADEITGGVEAMWESAKGDPATFGELYKRSRDESRQNYESAKNANPGTYTTGEIGGAIGTAFIPGLNAANGARLATLVGKGALVGGTAGLGNSTEEDVGGMIKDTATGAALGGALSGVIGKAAPYVAGKLNKAATRASGFIDDVVDNIQPARQKLNTKEIIEAADKLGIKVTPGMLDDTGFIERLESSLSKSPSIFGQSIKGKQEAVIRKLNDAGQELTSEASNLSPFQLGEKFKSGVTSKVGERLDPLSTVFQDVAESTKNIPIGERSLNAVKRNIENLDVYRLTGGAGKASQYADMIPKLQNADQVKTAMTLLRNDIQSAQGAEKQVLIAIKEKLENLEKNSIMRGAIETAKQGKLRDGKQIGTEIIGDLKEARQGYRNLNEDLRSVSEGARLKTQGGPTAFLDSLESVPSERVSDKFFNTENNRQLTNLMEKFPDEFNLLKQGRIKEIQDAAIDNSANGQGKFNASRFLKEVRKLNDEAKEMIFPGKAEQLGNIETVQQSIPRNFNPSGTASEQSWNSALYSNVKDVPNFMLYKAASSNLGRNIQGNILDVVKRSPQKLGKFANVLQNAEQRGPQGVAATHFILQSSNPEYRQVLQRAAEGEDE